MKTLNVLHQLECRLLNTQLPRAEKEWGGADVVISRNPHSENKKSFYPEPRYVVTNHALEVSWLFQELMRAFNAENLLDSCSKTEFFGRLANAANRSLQQSTNTTAHDLCTAVLHEAYTIYDEMEKGTFQSLAIAQGNEIVDDYVGAPEEME